jgi:hypothetical protein
MEIDEVIRVLRALQAFDPSASLADLRDTLQDLKRAIADLEKITGAGGGCD